MKTTIDPKTVYRKIYKFNKKKLRVQCLQRLLEFISFSFNVDIQVGLKPSVSSSTKSFLSAVTRRRSGQNFMQGERTGRLTYKEPTMD